MDFDDLEDTDMKIIHRLCSGKTEDEKRKRPGQLSDEIEDVSRPWISTRLKELEEKGLVTVEDTGRERYYTLVEDHREEIKKISAKVEDSQFINQTPVNQIKLENGKASIYGLPENAEESIEESGMSDDLQYLIKEMNEFAEEMNSQLEQLHRKKISQKYDEEIEHLDESIQKLIQDRKESVIELIWNDTKYSKGYLRDRNSPADNIVDSKYIMEKGFRGLDKTEGLEKFISELLQEVQRRRKLKIVAGN